MGKEIISHVERWWSMHIYELHANRDKQKRDAHAVEWKPCLYVKENNIVQAIFLLPLSDNDSDADRTQ